MPTPSESSYPENLSGDEEPNTMLCSYKDCQLKGIPQPLDNFSYSKKARNGRHWWCRVCVSIHRKLPTTRRRSNGTDVPELKVCTKKDCPFQGALQPIENFSRDRRVKNGIRSRCRTCMRNYENTLYARNPESQKIMSKEWYKNNYKNSKEYAHKPGISVEEIAKTRWTKSRWLGSAIARCRKRAGTKGLSCDIDESDLMPLPEFCPVFGLRLDYNSGPDKR